LAEVLCVDPAKVPELWPHVSDLVKRGLSYGSEDFEEVKEKVHSGLWLLWLVVEDLRIKGIVITALIGNACEIIAAAGRDFIALIHLIRHLEAFARAEGRERMLITGRRGWLRVLKHYHPIGTVGDLVSLERIL
jgi:hypothetical protein